MSWKFRIKRIGEYIAIGIDETQYLRLNCGLHDERGKTKVYAIWSDGDLSQWDQEMLTKNASSGYKPNDIVEMILDLTKREISLKTNDGKEVIVFKNIFIAQDIEYCMVVTLVTEYDEILLLDHRCD